MGTIHRLLGGLKGLAPPQRAAWQLTEDTPPLPNSRAATWARRENCLLPGVLVFLWGLA